jgi:glutamate-1-semialdehyde aminotransferase
MRAVLATIKILERDNGAAYKKMDKVQLQLSDGLQALAKKHGLPMRIQGNRGLFFALPGLDKDKVYRGGSG